MKNEKELLGTLRGFDDFFSKMHFEFMFKMFIFDILFPNLDMVLDDVSEL